MGNDCCTGDKPFEQSLFIAPKKAERPTAKGNLNLGFENPKNEKTR